MKYIVYLTVNIKNNKIYIGVHKTCDPYKFDGYLGCGITISSPSSYKKSKTPLQYAVNKYGVAAFKRTTLAVFDSAEEAYALEAKLVTSTFISRPDTYNACLGGCGGASTYVPVYSYDLNTGKLINEFFSIKEASDNVGVSSTAITTAIEEKRQSAGFYWSKEKINSIKLKDYLNPKQQGQEVFTYNTDGSFFKKFETVAEAAKFFKVSVVVIRTAIIGEYKVREYYMTSNFTSTFSISKKKVSLKDKAIFCYDFNGTLLHEFTTIAEAVKFFNIKTSSEISKSIRLKRPFKGLRIFTEKLTHLEKVQNNTRNIKVNVYKGGVLIEQLNTKTEAFNKYGRGVEKVLKGLRAEYKGYSFTIVK